MEGTSAAMSAYVVKAKRGAVIRLEASLESEHVSKLEMGTEVGVVETVELGEVTRCRLSHPVRGWCSLKVLETVSEAPPLALRDGAVLRVFESSGGDSESSRGGASVLGPPSWEVKHYQKRCGAVLRELAEGTRGASRDQLFGHLVVQHTTEASRAAQRFEGIPLEYYDSDFADDADAIAWIQLGGQIAATPPKGGHAKVATGGVRQKVARLGGTRCVVLERQVPRGAARGCFTVTSTRV